MDNFLNPRGEISSGYGTDLCKLNLFTWNGPSEPNQTEAWRNDTQKTQLKYFLFF